MKKSIINMVNTFPANDGDLRHFQYNGGPPMTEISVKYVFC